MLNYSGILTSINTLFAANSATKHNLQSPLSIGKILKKSNIYLSKILVLGIFMVCHASQLFAQQSTFTLKNPARTSAGIYNAQGSLIRTLWTAENYKAGTYKIEWDGKDNDGVAMPAGSYTVKVLSNNVQYSWEGIVGNTSTNKTGNTVQLSQYYFMADMAITGNTAYFCQGYSEGRASVNKFLTSKPQERLDVEKPRTTTANTDFVTTDGINTYWAAYDPYQTHIGYNFVYAKKVSDDSDITFPNGINFTLQHGRGYNAIGFKKGNEAMINGIAVQKNGNKLFIARPGINRLDVLDKTNGASLQSLEINGINTICMDPITDQLWVSRKVQQSIPYTPYSGSAFGSLSDASSGVAFDNNLTTVFTGSNQRGAYVGIDLGVGKKIGTIRLFPAGSRESYLNNCIIQGSNVSATDGFTDLYTVNNIRAGQYTDIQLNTVNNYRFIRITNPNNYLALAEMQVYGESINTIAIQPIEKYNVNNDGTLSNALISIMTVKEPIAMSVSPDGKKIAVADGEIGTQQVKFFNALTGTHLSTIGTAGGYMSDATVTNNKFYFNDIRGRLYEAGGPYGFRVFIAFQPDGSFWVNDPGNYRIQHYAADQTFIESVMAMGPCYSTWADKNDPTKVGSEYLEFKIDNSKSLSGSSGWILAKNWGALVSVKYDQFAKFKNVITLSSNGISRTFGCLRVLYANNNGLYDLVELQGNSIRFTGKNIFKCTIDKDGSLLTDDLKRYAFEGFDSSNNPVWSTNPESLADLSNLKDFGPLPKEGFRNTYVSSTGKLIFYDYGLELTSNPFTYNTGYHLGAIQKGGNAWLWRTAKGTNKDYTGPFPSPEFFDIGNSVNNYAGNSAAISDRNIITGYHGEFWKGSQTNMYNHYLDNGLALGQFGATGPVWDLAPAMMAGNAMTIEAVKDVNDDLYLWHGDESMHAGLHKWKITGLNTIEEQNIVILNPSIDIAPITVPGSNLMVNLPYNSALANNTAGWTINPTTSQTGWNIKTNYLVSRTDRSPDIFISCSAIGGAFSLNRDLGNHSGLSTWTISGEISYQGSDQQGAMKQYVDVLDANGRILARLTNKFGYVNDTGGNTNTFYGNDKILLTGLHNDVSGTMYSLNPVEISANNGLITIKYAGNSITTTKFDPAADINAPKTLRAYFEGGYNPTGRSFDFKDMRFIGAKENQTINFRTIGNKILSEASVTLIATASSGLLVDYRVISGPAVISGNTLIFNGAGTVVVEASQAGNALYSPATSVTQNFTIGSSNNLVKVNQTINFLPLSNKVVGDVPFTLNATASSGLPVIYKIVSGPATISANFVTLTGEGNVIVEASQDGNIIYSAAVPVIQSFTVNSLSKTNQSISFSALADKTFGDAAFTVAATASSALPVSFSIQSGPATVTGNLVTLTAVGTVSIQVDQAGNTTYNAANPVIQSFRVRKATQTITFNTIPSKKYKTTTSDETDNTFDLDASSSRGLPVSFIIISGPAIINGKKLTVTGPGVVVVQAEQKGNPNIEAAEPVTQTFIVNNPSKTDQSLNISQVSDKTYGDVPFTLVSSSTSGLPINYSILSGPATISGNVITITGAGEVIVSAVQAGNVIYNPATPAFITFKIEKAVQSINFPVIATANYIEVAGGATNSFTLGASSSQALPITYNVVSGPASVSGNKITLSGPGIVIITAKQTGNANIDAAAPVTRQFTVNKLAQINSSNSAPAETKSSASLKAYPNPMATESTVQFVLPETGKADINMYDLNGRLLKTLFSGQVQAETVNTLTLNRNGLATGLYVIRLVSAKDAISVKVIAN